MEEIKNMLNTGFSCIDESLRIVRDNTQEMKGMLEDGFTCIDENLTIICDNSTTSLEQTTITQLLQIKQMHATGALTDEEAILSSKNCMQILLDRYNLINKELKPRQETIDMYKRFVKIYKGTLTKTGEAGLNQ